MKSYAGRVGGEDVVRDWAEASVLFAHLNYLHFQDLLELSPPILYTPLPIANRLLLCIPNFMAWWIDSSGQIR